MFFGELRSLGKHSCDNDLSRAASLHGLFKPDFGSLPTRLVVQNAYHTCMGCVETLSIHALQTRRTRTAGKVEIPSVDDHVSKLEHMGRETVKKLSDVTEAAQQAGIDDLYVASMAGKRLCIETCLLYTSPSPRDRTRSRMPSSA